MRLKYSTLPDKISNKDYSYLPHISLDSDAIGVSMTSASPKGAFVMSIKYKINPFHLSGKQV